MVASERGLSKYSGVDTTRIIALWVESDNDPAAGRLIVKNSIVKAVGPALPELHFPRDHANASPVRRSGDRSPPVFQREPGHVFQKNGAAGQYVALLGGPSPQLRQTRTRGPIGVRFRIGNDLRSTLDAHLPLKRRPIKGEGGARCFLE